MSTEHAQVVCLLGAGASVNANLPTSNHLASLFHQHLVDRFEKDDSDVSRRNLHLFRFLDGGIRNQRGMLGEDPTSPVNIEQIATAALRLRNRQFNPLTPYVHGWSQRILDLESESPTLIDDFLSLMYGRLTAELGEKRNGEEGSWTEEDITYLALLKDLSDSAMDVFTLNYDLCVESAFTKHAAIQFRNGFTPVGWQPNLLEEPGGIRLFKLHGSLDWVFDHEMGICALEFPGHIDARHLGNATPLLIFGTDSKMTGEDPFLTLLYHFSQSLARCKVLVTVGYSFADGYINDIIKQRFNSNTRMRVLIVDPFAERIKNQISLLRDSPRVDSCSFGAKEALEKFKLRSAVRKAMSDATDNDPF